MIGGTLNYAPYAVESMPMRRQREKTSPHAKKLVEIVKFYGRIELRDIAKIMKISCNAARSAVVNATRLEGSMIYEEKVAGQTVIGWLE